MSKSRARRASTSGLDSDSDSDNSDSDKAVIAGIRGCGSCILAAMPAVF
jgi:hypothetical protein